MDLPIKKSHPQLSIKRLITPPSPRKAIASNCEKSQAPPQARAPAMEKCQPSLQAKNLSDQPYIEYLTEIEFNKTLSDLLSKTQSTAKPVPRIADPLQYDTFSQTQYTQNNASDQQQATPVRYFYQSGLLSAAGPQLPLPPPRTSSYVNATNKVAVKTVSSPCFTYCEREKPSRPTQPHFAPFHYSCRKSRTEISCPASKNRCTSLSLDTTTFRRTRLMPGRLTI